MDRSERFHRSEEGLSPSGDTILGCEARDRAYCTHAAETPTDTSKHPPYNAALAQMEEQLISNQWVGSSNLSSSTNKQQEKAMEPELKTSFLDALRYSYDDSYPTSYKQAFKVGDIVRLKSGEAPQKVIEVTGHCIRCEYVSSRKQIGFRSAADFVKYEYNVPNEEDKMEDYDMKDKLFKTLETGRFGTGLAIDSDGKYVLKMQDNGNFEAFSESELKRVMPYTFDVEFLSGSTNRANRYSYRGRDGSVQLGDLLILEDSANIARVVAVNTESEAATKTFKGRKLQTVELS